MISHVFTECLESMHVVGRAWIPGGLLPMLLVLAALSGCSSSDDLTEAEWEKIGTSLRAEMRSAQDDESSTWRVVVRTDSAEAIRAAGLPTETTTARVVTARWSLDQIRAAARLDAVRRISAVDNQPTMPSNSPGAFP